jgi:clan AA aspartic protease (TIGR02281 family)
LSPWIKLSCALGVLLVMMFASPTQSAIYKWKDEKGKTHFTDSLSKIPPQFRKKGDLKTMKGVPADSENSVKLLYPEQNSSSYAIPIKPHGGGHFIVEALINGSTKVNLMVDTGASMVILSDRLGDLLGVNNNQNLPAMNFSTAGGTIQSPLFILDSLKIGNAEVFGVEASTNPNFNGDVDGLLGMSFLGEFKLEMDRENFTMLLKPTAKRGENLWDGHNEAWWKKKYGTYVTNIRRNAAYRNNSGSIPSKQNEFRKMVRHYTKLHAILEKRADVSGLPKKYRVYP